MPRLNREEPVAAVSGGTALISSVLVLNADTAAALAALLHGLEAIANAGATLNLGLASNQIDGLFAIRKAAYGY